MPDEVRTSSMRWLIFLTYECPAGIGKRVATGISVQDVSRGTSKAERNRAHLGEFNIYY